MARRAAVAGFLVGVVWLVVAVAWAPSYRITCDPAVPRDVCIDTVRAALGRGLPRFRPFIIEAHVAPGPAFPDAYGHRATVTFSLLGPATDVRLFFDAGGHWGGVASSSDVELALWALLPAAALTAGAGLVLVRARR